MAFFELKNKGFEEITRSGEVRMPKYVGLHVNTRTIQFTAALAKKMYDASDFWRVFVDDEKFRLKLVPSAPTHPDSRKLHDYKSARNNDTGTMHSTYIINVSLNLPRTRYFVESYEEDGSIILTIER